MEMLQDTAFDLWEGYKWAVTRADKRVGGWLFMQDFYPTWCLTGLYLAIVLLGQRLMTHREPFNFKWTLVIYNLGLVALNFHILKELFIATRKLNYSYSCQNVNYSDDPDELRIARALWWYYISKLVEFLDTIFFVLRKKNNQISFLHVYHHATMFPIWWMGIKWVAGGQSFFGAMINSGIHVIMYTYYGLSALGPQYQKYLWWKKYLTRLQLIQFVVGMCHAVQSIYLQCDFPMWMQWALIVYGTTILALFLNFYFHAYVKSSHKQKSGKETEDARNGHIANISSKITGDKTHSKEKKKEK